MNPFNPDRFAVADRAAIAGRGAVTGRRALLLGAAALPFLPRRALAAEVQVMASGGLTAAYRALIPEFERSTGHKLGTVQGASMGAAPDAIPQRLARGEPADVLLLAADGLEALIARGLAQPGSRVDIARSLIGMCVRAGAPKPDISSMDAFRQALLNASSIAYSASASGVYIENEMYRKLGIHDQVMPKSRRILSERVGTVVARGDAEVGFQQVSELLPIQGIDYIGTIPEAVQQPTIFCAGIAANAREPEAARALIRFLASPEAAPVLTRTGLEPLGKS
ncbi:substrate-binding domain-containing protein [Muricoccus pecuniae]|uniref:Molybdate transport system substrate-binding protein n=1 Tax=Muricoccus pecuniae TaxID=693023 RepID=A0A840YHF7_9PROT|nr:substrate-binding domain-containing protein [Roseomonas pecuniae]MBB5693284.1 molybdate transport system substrate-binding protein [Roseomonas pecuniae]